MQQAAVHDPLIGQTIGNYEVRSKLGEGGMGAVYLAEHPLIGKKVALKVLHSEFSGNDDIATRFFHEAKAVNDIQHPNIVDILDYGVIPNQGQRTVYFIMEFLDGHSLAHVIRAQAPLPPERALSIALQIADALGASHKHEIVHRDLKPDNVILVQRGRAQDFVKVLDFGIAKLTGDHPGSRRTRTGIVMGTPAYMSPEQCEGKGDVDHRTDIYALGILLYEMLTGRVPFLGEGFGEVLVQHLTQPPIRLSQITPMIPPHVDSMVMKALAKKPEDRYPNMDEFMRALADPVGYVESHGGLGGFLDTQLSPSSGAFTPPTPAPGQIMTPLPGQIAPLYTPSPGTLHPPSGTYPPGAYPPSGAEESPSRGLHLAIIAFAATLVVALGIGGYFMFFAKSDKGTALADTAGLASEDAGSSAAPLGTTEPDVKPETETTQQANNTATDNVAGTGTDTQTDSDSTEVAKEPEMVTVTVATEPKGAEVYLDDEKEPRGTTPLNFELEKSDTEITLSIKLNRHKTETRTFTPDKNKDFDLSLNRVRRTSRRTGKSGKDKDKDTGKKIDKDVGLMTPDF